MAATRGSLDPYAQRAREEEVSGERLRPRPAVRHVHHPDGPAAAAGRPPGAAQRAARARPRHVPGPPLPACVPRHVDADVVCRGPHRADPPVRQRGQPPAAAAGRPGPRGGEPGPAQRRAPRARARGRSVLGRDRGDGRAASGGGGIGRGGGGGHRGHPGPVGHRDPRWVSGSPGSTTGWRAPSGAGAGARHPHLGGRAEAADAAAGREDGRRLAAQPEPPRRPAGDRGRQRRDRRVGGGSRARPPRDPAAAQPRPRRTRRPSS